MNDSAQIEKFEQYADTHPMAKEVAVFERNFYAKYLNDFSGHILDIGSGDGRYVTFLKSVCPRGIVVPCDLSIKRVQRINQGGFSGIVGSATKLPFQDNSFERVFLMQVIEHIPDSESVARECARVLKRSGYCFVTTPNYPISRVYNWVDMLRFRKWHKFFDDPTHCSRFSVRKLEYLLKRHFKTVDIYPTFILGESKSRHIQYWKEARKSSLFFSHKILALCRS